MRVYHLSSSVARSTVDLRNYESVITEAVTTVMSGKDVTIVVYKENYTVSPAPSKSEAIKIGRLICKSALSQYCIQIPKLFTGENVKPKKEESNESRTEPKAKHPMGGHQ